MYLLRVATHADIPALRSLMDASVRRLSIGYYDDAQIDAALRHLLGVDTQLLDDGTYYVVEHDDGLAAAGGWSGRRTLFGGDQFKHGVDVPVDPQHEPARIRAFYVHPSHARRGLARMLFRECAAQAWAAGFRRLELVATLPGEPLYRALGFAIVGPIVVPLPGAPEMRGWRMTRELTAADGTGESR